VPINFYCDKHCRDHRTEGRGNARDAGVDTLILGVAIFGAFGWQAWSQNVPRYVLGEWVRIEGVSELPLSIEASRSQLRIEDHLDGEGYECTIPISDGQAREMGRTARKLSLIVGIAVCRAEENPAHKGHHPFIVLEKTGRLRELGFCRLQWIYGIPSQEMSNNRARRLYATYWPRDFPINFNRAIFFRK
jgi:hypothetical protein